MDEDREYRLIRIDQHEDMDDWFNYTFTADLESKYGIILLVKSKEEVEYYKFGKTYVLRLVEAEGEAHEPDFRS